MKLINVFWYALWLSVAAILIVGFPPYLKVLGSSPANFGLEAVPFIGVIIASILRLILRLIALPLYIVVQTLEILPIVVFNSQVILGKIISRGNSSRKIEISSDDSFPEKLTKKAYNSIPYAIVRDCLQWATAAYLIDFAINAVGLPPAKGGVGNLPYLLATQQFDQLNWTNIFRILTTLFLLEAVVLLLIQISRIRAIIREEA